MMTMIDEYNRQSLVIRVARRMTSDEVLATLCQAMARYGIPAYIRNDNGSEFIAKQVQI